MLCLWRFEPLGEGLQGCPGCCRRAPTSQDLLQGTCPSVLFEIGTDRVIVPGGRTHRSRVSFGRDSRRRLISRNLSIDIYLSSSTRKIPTGMHWQQYSSAARTRAQADLSPTALPRNLPYAMSDMST